MPKAVEESKKQISQFISRWQGKSQLMDTFARDAKSLIIDLNVVEDEVRKARGEKVRVESEIARLKDEMHQRMDASQQNIDNHHAKLTEERVKLAAEKRLVDSMKKELQVKLTNLDRQIIAKKSEKDLAKAKSEGN